MRKTYLKVLSESKYCVNTLTSMDSHRPPDGNNNEQKFQEDTEESFFVFFCQNSLKSIPHQLLCRQFFLVSCSHSALSIASSLPFLHRRPAHY